MAGPYQRLSNGASADSGDQALIDVVNDVEAGLEDAEATITAQAALIAGKASTAHTHSGTYDPAGSAAAAQAAAVQRANHTGTQAATTVSTSGHNGLLSGAGTVQEALALVDNLALGGGSAHSVEDEGLAVAQRSTLNFVGSGVEVTDVGGKTRVSIPGAGVGTVTGTKLVNVQDHGIKADAVQITVNVTAAANAVVTCIASSLGTASVFTPDDVGKHVHLDHNGYNAKAWTKLTITGYTSPTQVTLSGSFGSNMNGVNAIFMTDNTSAITACLLALQENETLYWPAPAKGKWYFTNGDHNWTRPNTAMLGEPTRSGIITTNTTGYIFKINNSYQDVENLAFTHAAVFTDWGGTVNGTYGTSSALQFELASGNHWGGGVTQNCSFNGFYIGFSILLGIGYNIYKCFFSGHSMAGVSVMNYGNPDSGSFRVFGCDFYTDPAYNGGALAGIRVYTAGGVWLDGCHFFRGEYGILCSLFGNPSTNLRITSHSFEDYSDSAVTSPLVASEKIALEPFGLRYLQGSAIAVTQGGASDFLHSIVIANNNLNTIFGGPGIILGGAGGLSKGLCSGNAGSTSGAPIVLTGNSPTYWQVVANQTGSTGSQVVGTAPHSTFKVVV